MDSTFLLVVEIIGTFAFAISGIKAAASKQFDWFGAYIVGLVTAIGGGTLRDLLLNTTPFWMNTFWYLGVTGLALLAMIIFSKHLKRLDNTILLFDTIGLALFVLIGVQKTLEFNFPMWLAIIMGTITGAFGGVIRDILVNEEPIIFRKDVYGTACIAGGLIYWGVLLCGAAPWLQQLSCGISVIIIRYAAVRYGWTIPILQDRAANVSK